MDELNNGEQGQYVEPGKNEKKNNTRKIVKRTFYGRTSFGCIHGILHRLSVYFARP